MRKTLNEKPSFQNETFKEVLSVFEDLENNEVLSFIDGFRDTYPELAKELMVMVENEVMSKVESCLDDWRQFEICFFSEENEMKIKSTIKKSIWKQIMIDLIEYGL